MSCRISLRRCDPSAVCHQVGRVMQQKLLNWFREMRSYCITESSADKSVKSYKAPVCDGPPDQSADEEKKGNPGRTAEETYAHKCTGSSLACNSTLSHASVAFPQSSLRWCVLLRTYVRYKFSWCQSGATTNCNHSAHFSPRSAAIPICSNVTGRLQTFFFEFLTF